MPGRDARRTDRDGRLHAVSSIHAGSTLHAVSTIDACGTLDFHRAVEMIELGRRLTTEALTEAGIEPKRK